MERMRKALLLAEFYRPPYQKQLPLKQEIAPPTNIINTANPTEYAMEAAGGAHAGNSSRSRLNAMKAIALSAIQVAHHIVNTRGRSHIVFRRIQWVNV
ncbi:MAG: hypothetical protein ING60_05625 [Rhodocyclaceae bacterium]|nr:hypothetical protein [Rhodocyclaceae bacterium]MCA3037192.1 hypothetical protein [Rhodocyclaceae bacterium]MCA3041436.1 hypothetical protein [Rhodocyclaceae bacterium]MCA3044752.1 hypothetical protein [Rhodocyclaceae bacterium]MCA3048207.1 hypothetical protein [Rhodocyclaceae bacterium]